MTAALKGHKASAMKVSEFLMEGKGVPSDPELALMILILLADHGCVEAQDMLRSMTDYDLADCRGDELVSSEYPEDSWGQEVLERIGSLG